MYDQPSPFARFLDSVGYAIFCFLIWLPGVNWLVAGYLLSKDANIEWRDD